jgi:hypothetical protein
MSTSTLVGWVAGWLAAQLVHWSSWQAPHRPSACSPQCITSSRASCPPPAPRCRRSTAEPLAGALRPSTGRYARRPAAEASVPPPGRLRPIHQPPSRLEVSPNPPFVLYTRSFLLCTSGFTGCGGNLRYGRIIYLVHGIEGSVIAATLLLLTLLWSITRGEFCSYSGRGSTNFADLVAHKFISVM